MSDKRILEVKNLEVYYGGIHALHDINMHINQGEIVTIIGANGAGKSTLLNTIAGDKEKKHGNILFEEIDVPEKSYKAVERGICLVPEGRRIFVNLTVKENLRIGAFLEKKSSTINRLYDEVFELFPRLKERTNQIGGTLSGGEQQMLAVGRALMARPKLLMLDEPSLGLAPIVIDEMFEKIVQINRELGTTILLVEQNAFIALDIANRGYILNVGKVTIEDNASDLMENPIVQEAYMGIK
ncbi:ABC transporter ATP-binding protein [Paratissierella segnis]|jgi:branched-chain amino acid transport system ATP-binding protein|uniref:ABC transporter ATP-binding protein n=1 Tax=Paratissierella segnis TaxID=2763679 RepID=A0A926EYK3_9FIRM|nr:ABC transporter ATP-binding protein [Paratissierella segnis]MBC8588610.1 ABC transporter ATP-binding protein [Paratissierella segnis]